MVAQFSVGIGGWGTKEDVTREGCVDRIVEGLR
jgi:hypothetical protein